MKKLLIVPIALLCAGSVQATIIGFDARVDGVNDCASDVINGCYVVTDDSSPAIPNPISPNPNDGQLLVWNELQNFTLIEALLVDRVADPLADFVSDAGGGEFYIAAGTVVSSHYAQWDPGEGSESRVDTALAFDSDIFAFITDTPNLFASDHLGLPGHDYSDFGFRGLEGGDTTEFGADLTRVDISWRASSPGDWTRIITAFSPAADDMPDDSSGGGVSVPEPASLLLFVAGIVGLGFSRRKH